MARIELSLGQCKTFGHKVADVSAVNISASVLCPCAFSHALCVWQRNKWGLWNFLEGPENTVGQAHRRKFRTQSIVNSAQASLVRFLSRWFFRERTHHVGPIVTGTNQLHVAPIVTWPPGSLGFPHHWGHAVTSSRSADIFSIICQA